MLIALLSIVVEIVPGNVDQLICFVLDTLKDIDVYLYSNLHLAQTR